MNSDLDIFICPLCGNQMYKDIKCLKCENGHNFDIASQGYVNLDASGRIGR